MSRSCTRILYTNSFSMVLVSPSKFAYFRTSAMNLSAETSSFSYPAFFRGHQRVGTPEYLSMMRLRKIWAEGSFSVLKREHCISKIRKRGILAATEECLLAAMALNLKRMAKFHLSLSPNLLFCWGHDGFQQFFCFCQQVHNTSQKAFGIDSILFTSVKRVWTALSVCPARASCRLHILGYKKIW